MTPLLCNLIVPFHSHAALAMWLLWSIEFGGNEDFFPSLSVLEPCHHLVKDECCQVFQMRPSQTTWPQLCESTQWRGTQLPTWPTVNSNQILTETINITYLTINSCATINTFKIESSISIFIPMTLNLSPPPNRILRQCLKLQNQNKINVLTCVNIFEISME